jgi:hypothetical protein
MTQDEIIEMAKQVGLFTHREVQPEIVAFAKLVAEKALAQRSWVGLTDEGRQAVFYDCGVGKEYDISACQDELRYARAIEAKLKQKNGYAEEKNT